MTNMLHIDGQSVCCPACGTRFRLRAEQLQLADGLVRCGICMHIFNALEHLNPIFVNTPASAEPAIEVQAHSALTPSEGATDTPPPAAEAIAGTPIEQADPVSSENEEIDALALASADDAESDELQQVASAAESETDDFQDDDIAPTPLNPEEILNGLSTVGHDFDHHRSNRKTYRRAPWLILNLIALLALSAQLAYWQREFLLNTPYRDQILQICEFVKLHCQVDTAAATPPSTVVSRNLLVRKHPEKEDALQVDAILMNQGEKVSDFPLLYLRFSDIHNQEIASRIFTPSEYLDGELSTSTKMLGRQPVRIALEIVDPGELAVNYSLELLSPLAIR